jgi:hypothetical protein
VYYVPKNWYTDASRKKKGPLTLRAGNFPAGVPVAVISKATASKGYKCSNS